MPNYDVHAKHHFLKPNQVKKAQISAIWPKNVKVATLIQTARGPHSSFRFTIV